VRRLLTIILPIIVLGISDSSLAIAGEFSRGSGEEYPTVQGQLVTMDGNILTVKDSDGKRQRLVIDQETAQFGALHQGVHVQAWMDEDGRTESIVAFRTNRDTERELAAN